MEHVGVPCTPVESAQIRGIAAPTGWLGAADGPSYVLRRDADRAEAVVERSHEWREDRPVPVVVSRARLLLDSNTVVAADHIEVGIVRLQAIINRRTSAFTRSSTMSICAVGLSSPPS